MVFVCSMSRRYVTPVCASEYAELVRAPPVLRAQLYIVLQVPEKRHFDSRKTASPAFPDLPPSPNARGAQLPSIRVLRWVPAIH